MTIATVILSRPALKLARQLRDREIISRIFGPSCIVGSCGGPTSPTLAKTFETDETGVFGWRGPLRLVFPDLWRNYEGIIAIMTMPILVRLVGPLVGDTRQHPTVIAVDEVGQFVIPVLGGREKLERDLAKRVAESIGAQLVFASPSRSHQL